MIWEKVSRRKILKWVLGFSKYPTLENTAPSGCPPEGVVGDDDVPSSVPERLPHAVRRLHTAERDLVPPLPQETNQEERIVFRIFNDQHIYTGFHLIFLCIGVVAGLTLTNTIQGVVLPP